MLLNKYLIKLLNVLLILLLTYCNNYNCMHDLNLDQYYLKTEPLVKLKQLDDSMLPKISNEYEIIIPDKENINKKLNLLPPN